MSSIEPSRTLVVFPGQGSLGTHAGQPWTDAAAWSVVHEISDTTHIDVSALLVSAPAEDLVRTDNAQIATFALSMVGWRHFREHHPSPAYFAGHSLGEISALVAADVLTLADGAALVAARGRAMRDAADQNPGTMIALMGPSEGAEDAVAQCAGVYVANRNGPGQIVVSGPPAAMDDVAERYRELGWRRATRLNVGGAFHSPLMVAAQVELNDALEKTQFLEGSGRVASNVDAHFHDGGDHWRARLREQMTSPVDFEGVIASVPVDVDTVIEMPPAGTLVGLIKRIRDFALLTPLNAPESWTP